MNITEEFIASELVRFNGIRDRFLVSGSEKEAARSMVEPVLLENAVSTLDELRKSDPDQYRQATSLYNAVNLNRLLCTTKKVKVTETDAEGNTLTKMVDKVVASEPSVREYARLTSLLESVDLGDQRFTAQLMARHPVAPDPRRAASILAWLYKEAFPLLDPCDENLLFLANWWVSAKQKAYDLRPTYPICTIYLGDQGCGKSFLATSISRAYAKAFTWCESHCEIGWRELADPDGRNLVWRRRAIAPIAEACTLDKRGWDRMKGNFTATELSTREYYAAEVTRVNRLTILATANDSILETKGYEAQRRFVELAFSPDRTEIPEALLMDRLTELWLALPMDAHDLEPFFPKATIDTLWKATQKRQNDQIEAESLDLVHGVFFGNWSDSLTKRPPVHGRDLAEVNRRVLESRRQLVCPGLGKRNFFRICRKMGILVESGRLYVSTRGLESLAAKFYGDDDLPPEPPKPTLPTDLTENLFENDRHHNASSENHSLPGPRGDSHAVGQSHQGQGPAEATEVVDEHFVDEHCPPELAAAIEESLKRLDTYAQAQREAREAEAELKAQLTDNQSTDNQSTDTHPVVDSLECLDMAIDLTNLGKSPKEVETIVNSHYLERDEGIPMDDDDRELLAELGYLD